jgi:PAS domain S-box-containing protein
MRNPYAEEERMTSMQEMAPWPQVMTTLPMQTPAGEQENDWLQAKDCARADTSAPPEDDIPYHLLVEHANDAIIILQNGRVVYQNTAHITMLGYSTVELEQGDFLSCVAPEDRQRTTGYYHQRLRGEPVPEQYTVDLVSSTGKRITAEVKARVIAYRGQLATLIVTRDITQRHHAEQALDRAHQHMTQLLQAIPSLLIGLDARHTVVWWNTTAEKLLGRTAAEVVGQRLSTCSMPWHASLILQGLTTCQGTGEAVRLDDIPFQYTDGTRGYLGISISCVPASKDEDLHFLLMGQDVTRRRQLESQLARRQKLEAIGQLAAGIAHEINTPTQYIGDNIRFLQDAFGDLRALLTQYKALLQATRAGAFSSPLLRQIETTAAHLDSEFLIEEIPQAIQQSLEGIERVTKIVQAMKVFSHPGMGHKIPIDLNRAIESTITVARNEWKHIAEVALDLDPALPLVPCLPDEINQVVLNLIVNAAHAIADVVDAPSTEKGGIAVRTRQEPDGIVLSITDTGSGIPAAIRDRIFDPFFTTKAVGKGTGQGLAIAYDVIVRKHAGTITFDTVEGEGTTFIVRLPLAGV